jgi:predicted small lipoprotein YifL
MKTLMTLLTMLMLTACGCKTPAPVGIVYPPTRTDVPRAVAVQIESTGRWIWEISANNNQPIARSEQDFATAPAAMENYRDVRASMIAWPDAEVSTLKL